MNSYAHRLASASVHAASRLPLLRGPLQLAYERYFNRATGQIRLFSGVYPTFAAAKRAIPAGRLSGYDNAQSAKRLSQDLFRLFPMDYPVLFWLHRLLPKCRLLFDWGGNIGISYFAFRRHLEYPPALQWLVSDLPAIVKEGLEVAASQQAPGLEFSTSMEQLGEADVLLAAGVLHFIERPLEILRSQSSLPRHILLNKVPVYPLPSAVTLQNMGTALLPNHLFNEPEFLEGFRALGYRLIDEWETDLACHIPFFPEHSISHYKGYYLTSTQ